MSLQYGRYRERRGFFDDGFGRFEAIHRLLFQCLVYTAFYIPSQKFGCVVFLNHEKTVS